MLFRFGLRLFLLTFHIIYHSPPASANIVSLCEGQYDEGGHVADELPVLWKVTLGRFSETLSNYWGAALDGAREIPSDSLDIDELLRIIPEHIGAEVQSACGEQYRYRGVMKEASDHDHVTFRFSTGPPCLDDRVAEPVDRGLNYALKNAIEEAVPGITASKGFHYDYQEIDCGGPDRIINAEKITPMFSIIGLEEPYMTPDYPHGIQCAICGMAFSDECQQTGGNEEWEKQYCAWEIECKNEPYKHYFHLNCINDWPKSHCPTCGTVFQHKWVNWDPESDDYDGPDDYDQKK